MIYKSYTVEQNFSILENNITLFYGENIGLIQEFKEKIVINNRNDLLLRLNQEQILKDPNHFYNEINNTSLFNSKKIFIIENSSDKILDVIKDIILKIKENKIFIFAGVLEKKSKLRIFFEKNESTNIIPCYQDNDITIKKIILNKLKGYSGLNTTMINNIADNCSSDRSKLNGEIEKIKALFNNKIIEHEKLIKLMNLREDDDFNIVKDNAVLGSKLNTNKLLNSVYIDAEKTPYYLATINQRFYKIKEAIENSKNIETAVNNLRPQIFWKDKPILIKQCKLWDVRKIDIALDKTYAVELMVKSKSDLDKTIIFKKLIVDICNLANAA